MLPEGDVQTPGAGTTLEALQTGLGTQDEQEAQTHGLKKGEGRCLRGWSRSAVQNWGFLHRLQVF